MRRIGLVRSFPFPASCMLVCGLCASLVLSFWAYRQEERIEQADFERHAQFRVAAVEQGVNNAIEALQVVHQLFVTNGSVSRAQFQSFTQPLRARYSYIDSFAFNRLVSHAERPAFEAQMRTRYPGFMIAEIADGKLVAAAVKDHYRIIDYLEPMAGNEAVFGLDASSRPAQENAIRRATETGLPAATGLYSLFRDRTGAQRGFQLLMPVYQGGVAPDDVASRRLAVTGYVVTVLRTDALFEKILASVGPRGKTELDIRVYAAASADESKLVYGLADAAREHREQWSPVWWLGDRLESRSHGFDVAGTAWHMVISEQQAPFASMHAIALLALLMGLLASVAATACVRSSVLRTRRIEQLVAQRTDQLKQVNDYLIDDIAARKQAEQALRDSESALRQLTSHLQRVREDERKRIARDIHDDLGQNLMVLRIDVARMASRSDSVALSAERIAAALRQVDTTIKAVRAIINDLRPAALDLGLPSALKWLVTEFEQRTGIACQLQLDHGEFVLDEQCATALFRIVQEALSNVVRHARASRVRIDMQRTDEFLLLKIADDGIGFVAGSANKANAFGLLGIEERIAALGGTLSIVSNPGQGLAILLSIPL